MSAPKIQGLVIPKANPGVSWGWIVNLLVTVLRPVLDILTPMVRAELEKLASRFYEKAEGTSNPWDDFIAEFLLKILGMPIPPH